MHGLVIATKKIKTAFLCEALNILRCIQPKTQQFFNGSLLNRYKVYNHFDPFPINQIPLRSLFGVGTNLILFQILKSLNVRCELQTKVTVEQESSVTLSTAEFLVHGSCSMYISM